MMNWSLYQCGLWWLLGFAALGWLLSVARRNVTLVDSQWSLFFLLAALVNVHGVILVTPRAWLVLALVAVWAARLFIYLTWRNWGAHEDLRYQQIRRNNQPHFWLKSLYIVFALQACLAWLISLPIHAAITATTPLNWLDLAGAALWLFGLTWESVGDWQLARFKAAERNQGLVMDQGLWRLSRHPNYFGESVLWWGFWLIAFAGGGWWSLPAPLLMTFMLLKVSGVSLLEKDIVERRPAYADYIRRTSSFIPHFPKKDKNKSK